jgi:hypothetical protein
MTTKSEECLHCEHCLALTFPSSNSPSTILTLQDFSFIDRKSICSEYLSKICFSLLHLAIYGVNFSIEYNPMWVGLINYKLAIIIVRSIPFPSGLLPE